MSLGAQGMQKLRSDLDGVQQGVASGCPVGQRGLDWAVGQLAQ